MKESYRRGFVYVRNIYAGIIEETDYGYSFKYDSEYLKFSEASSVSLTLPLQEDIYKSTTLFPFFDGLIPEGWLLSIVSHNWKVSLNDRFGLLLIACKDPVGNVTVKETKA